MDFLTKNTLYLVGYEGFYDAMYGGKGDIESIKKKIVDKTNGPVLELACGRGRVLFALVNRFREDKEKEFLKRKEMTSAAELRQQLPRLLREVPSDIGRQFVGLDILSHHIKSCNSKAKDDHAYHAIEPPLLFIKGDMCKFDEYLPQGMKFSAIILCNSSFLHIGSEKQRESLFKCVEKRLLFDGIFFLEYADTFHKNTDWEEKTTAEKPYLINGKGYRMWRKNVFSPRSNVAIRFFEFVSIKDSVNYKLAHVTTYPVDYDELKKTIKRIGLRIIKEDDAWLEEKTQGKKNCRRILFVKLGRRDEG